MAEASGLATGAPGPVGRMARLQRLSTLSRWALYLVAAPMVVANLAAGGPVVAWPLALAPLVAALGLQVGVAVAAVSATLSLIRGEGEVDLQAPDTGALSRWVVGATSPSVVLTAVMAAARLTGAASWPWPLVAVPALVGVALAVVGTLVVVRAGLRAATE